MAPKYHLEMGSMTMATCINCSGKNNSYKVHYIHLSTERDLDRLHLGWDPVPRGLGLG